MFVKRISRYIYSFLYYPRFHVTGVGHGTYYPWIRGYTYILPGIQEYQALNYHRIYVGLEKESSKLFR
jgi:hypothetical protein